MDDGTRPGWHPDPDGPPGALRWWNGVSWGERRAADGSAQPTPVADAARPAGLPAFPRLLGHGGPPRPPRPAPEPPPREPRRLPGGDLVGEPGARVLAWCFDLAAVAALTVPVTLGVSLVAAVARDGGVTRVAAFAIALPAVFAAYHVVSLRVGGATPAKHVAGLRVRPARGGRLGWSAIARRVAVSGLATVGAAVSLVSDVAGTALIQAGLVLLAVGVVLLFARRDARTAHDAAAGTVVVAVGAEHAASDPPGPAGR